jgi:arylformamidase
MTASPEAPSQFSLFEFSLRACAISHAMISASCLIEPPRPVRPSCPATISGYWRRLSSKEFSFVARGPVALGITMVVTNYALCPRVTLPEITRQSRAAIAWLYKTERTFAGDPERIYVSGHSAGGHQVARLLSTNWVEDYGLPPDVIKGGLSISGLFDLLPLRFSFLQPMLQLTADIVHTESPLFTLPRRAAPLVATVGGDESTEFRRQSADYQGMEFIWSFGHLSRATGAQPLYGGRRFCRRQQRAM